MMADLVIPRSPAGYEPLCAVYTRRRARANPARHRCGGRCRRRGFRKVCKVVEIGPEIIERYDPDDLLFVNVNTPHDYERAQG